MPWSSSYLTSTVPPPLAVIEKSPQCRVASVQVHPGSRCLKTGSTLYVISPAAPPAHFLTPHLLGGDPSTVTSSLSQLHFTSSFFSFSIPFLYPFHTPTRVRSSPTGGLVGCAHPPLPDPTPRSPQQTSQPLPTPRRPGSSFPCSLCPNLLTFLSPHLADTSSSSAESLPPPRSFPCIHPEHQVGFSTPLSVAP